MSHFLRILGVKQFLYVLIFLFLICSTKISANELNFKRYTLEDGLSQSVVLDIVQDSKGFIWIATQDGLNRFDGYEFKVYRHNPNDTNTISQNWINTLNLDIDENLWIGTEYGGMNKLDLKSNQVTRYQFDSTITNSIAGNTIRSIKEDQNGKLWIATWGHGISLFDKNNDQFSSIKNDPNDPNSLSNDFVRTICVSKNGTVWIGTGNGLNKYDESTNQFERFYHQKNDQNSLTEDFIVSIYEDNNEKIWIGTRKGLNCINPVNNSVKRFVNDESKKNSFPANIILDIYEDENSTIWAATYSKGIVKFDYSNISEEIEYNVYNNQNTNPKSISGNYVRKIFQDKGGIMWAGTWGAGLNKYNPQPPKFNHIRADIKQKISLSYPYVRSFMVDKDSNLWVGTHGKGIDIFNKTFTTKENQNLAKIDLSGLSENTVFSMYEEDNIVWIATDDGLYKYNVSQKQTSKIFFDEKIYTPVNRKMRVKQIQPFKNHLLLATQSGVALYNPVENNFQYFDDIWKTQTVLNKSVNFMIVDKNNNLWVATAYDGLYKATFDKTETEIIPIDIKVYVSGNGTNNISDNKINHICIAKDGVIWIGTNQGLNRLDPESGEIILYLEEDGLANNLIYGIVEDDNGNLWISTNNGLSKSFVENGKRVFRNYIQRDGLQSNEFNQASCYKSSDGTVYFGGINGFNYFKPEEVTDNQNLPQIEITRIKVVDEDISPRKLKNNTLEVSYFQNILSFTFAALEYTDPVRNKYKYLLEGFHDEWIDAGNFRYATFTNLDPGDYKLKVIASNNDGIWTNEAGILNIIVNPPFYQTYWFYSLVTSLFLFVVYRFYYIKIQRKLEMDKLRLKIASDLHDEVGSSLSQIAINASMINYESDIDKIKKKGEIIQTKSGAMINTMNDVIWSIDSRNDRLESLIDRIKRTAMDLASSKEIRVDFQIKISTPHKNLKVNLRQNIFLIVKEAINNAVKYSGAELITIRISESSDILNISVVDNGSGLPEKIESKGSGLKNMKHRAELINGKVNFINNNGLTIELSVELK